MNPYRSQHGSSSRSDNIFRHPGPGNHPILSEPIGPHVSEVSSLGKTGQVWQSHKEQFDQSLLKTKVMLGNAAMERYKPSPHETSVDLHQERLKNVNGKLKGWERYFTSEEGKKADPEGRRAESAHHKAVFVEKWHNLADVLKPNVHGQRRWDEVAGSIPGQIEKIEKDYRDASTRKQETHRHRYGLFVQHMADGGTAEEIPFKSSLQAIKEKQRGRY